MPRGHSLFVEFEGQTVAFADLCRRFGIRRDTVATRMKAGYSLERALTAPLFELRKKRGPNKHRRQRKPKVIDRDPHAPLTPAETEAALTWAVRLECAMPWVKHPQPVDARDVRRLAQ